MYYGHLAENGKVDEAKWAAVLAFSGLLGERDNEAIGRDAVQKISKRYNVRKALEGIDTLVACDAQTARASSPAEDIRHGLQFHDIFNIGIIRRGGWGC